MAVNLLRHCAEEMNHLAGILPALYLQHSGVASGVVPAIPAAR
jgi:hypothetical protein